MIPDSRQDANAAGELGVPRAIEIIKSELDVTMALTGVKTVGEIDRQKIAAM